MKDRAVDCFLLVLLTSVVAMVATHEGGMHAAEIVARVLVAGLVLLGLGWYVSYRVKNRNRY